MQAGGVSCICTDQCALAEVVGSRGFILKGKTNEELTNETLFLLKNMNFDTKLSKIRQGIDFAKSQTWDKLAQKWLSLVK